MTNISNEWGFEIEPHTEDAVAAQAVASRSGPSRRSLLTILRVFGACAVIASLSLFLIEGWKDGNDLSRYIKLLAQTGLITGGGIFLSLIVKEAKGARVFFGLALAATVANFTILGALTYSIFQLDGALGDYPSMLKWAAVEPLIFLPLALGAIALLSLVARFSFGIFARAEANRLTVSFLALNSLLLIPARDASYASIIAAIALIAAAQITAKIIKQNTLLLTTEAKCALACLFLPGLVIVARALGLYAVDELLLLTICCLCYGGLRSVMSMPKSQTLKSLLTLAQFIIGMTAAGLLSSLVTPKYIHYIGVVFSISALVIMFDQVKQTLIHNTQMSNVIVSLSTIPLVAISVLGTAWQSSIFIALLNLAIVVGLSSLIHLFARTIPNLRGNHIMALIGVIATSLLLAGKFVSLFAVGSWVLFGGLGIVLILVASLYEKYGDSLKVPFKLTSPIENA